MYINIYIYITSPILNPAELHLHELYFVDFFYCTQLILHQELNPVWSLDEVCDNIKKSQTTFTRVVSSDQDKKVNIGEHSIFCKMLRGVYTIRAS